ncbi:MAG TPA: gluconokinase [Sporichthyaceae bacterium]
MADRVDPPVLVLMGVSGAGKSSVAALLAGRLGWPFAEGDDMHPQANIDKMAAGHPLDDADRWPWLERIAEWIRERVAAGEGGIVTCSALKRRYRDVLRGPGVLFVYLTSPKEQIAQRLLARHGHFMPTALLDSQFADLEPPGPDENALSIEVTGTAEQTAAQILTHLEGRG